MTNPVPRRDVSLCLAGVNSLREPITYLAMTFSSANPQLQGGAVATRLASPVDPAMRPVMIWLFIVAGLIAGMVMVGGATRLTDSGLSITEWAPISGALPPLSDATWEAAFEKYKTIPEYQTVNYGMSLAEFKVIFWWEWGHRLYGRFLGLAFLLPLIFFSAKGLIDRTLGGRLAILFVLGGLQGVIGWWMVASGLSDRVDVSQYRLATHLGLAVILFGGVLWTAFDLQHGRRRMADAMPLAPWALGLAGAIYMQIILGAFVAGLRAGKTYNTWPLMDGRIVPEGYFTATPGLSDMFETFAAVQFNHRLGAYLVCGLAIFVVWRALQTSLRSRAVRLGAAVACQFLLGIWTVLAATPIALGLAHQAGALALFALALHLAHGAMGAMSMTKPSSSGS